MSAARLVAEFGGSDCGPWMNVFHKGVNIRVAGWNQANMSWDVLPAGHALLAAKDALEKAAEVVIEAEVAPVVRRAKRQSKVADSLVSAFELEE